MSAGELGGYRIVRELERLGDVRRLLAIDPGLERQVEIHLLPESASAQRVAWMYRTAGLLARMNHPNLAPVHRVSPRTARAAYYVVPHLADDTLAARLAGAPLSSADVLRLAEDMLAGVGAAHAAEVTGGELDPATSVCVDGRWVLTGLGIARAAAVSRWVSPEEQGGLPATPSSDLYVAGLVLRSAFGVRGPRRMRPALERALSVAPAGRWPDAKSFRTACRTAGRRRSVHRASGLAAAAAAFVLAAWGLGWLPFPAHPPPPLYQLAVLPFYADTDDPDSSARDLAGLLQLDLDGTPGLSIASARYVLKQLPVDDRGAVIAPEVVGADLVRKLRATWVAQGRVERQGSAVRVGITLYDPDGRAKPLPTLDRPALDLALLSDSLALQVLAVVAHERVVRYVPRAEVQGVPLRALKAFLRGEEAFGRDEHSRAERYFEDAVRVDSTFALAAWRLANVRRWRRLPVDVDLRTLYERHGRRLGPTDRRLLEALLEPDLRRRFAMLDTAVANDPDDAYARLIYGEELWHRGPLIGIDVEEATRMMASAVAADSALAQAYDHIIMYHIREGDADEAWRTFEKKLRVSVRPSPGDPDTPRLFRLALYERFDPWKAAAATWWLRVRHDASDSAGLAMVSRLGVPWFDIPEAQIALSQILLRYVRADDSAGGSARVGMALGHLAQGHVARGLALLDAAAETVGTDEMRLQQAEWRLLPPALGVRGWFVGDPGPWYARLERYTNDPTLGPRARWALALARLGAGDTSRLLSGLATSSESSGATLDVLLRAIRAGVAGRPEEALAVADSVQSAFEVTQPPDPFAGAAFHLLRGGWELARGDSLAADREWLWYQAAEFEGWPNAQPQAAEVDGVLGVFARWKRAELRLATATGSADTNAACRMIRRVAELWKDADASLAPLHSAILARARGRSPC